MRLYPAGPGWRWSPESASGLRWSGCAGSRTMASREDFFGGHERLGLLEVIVRYDAKFGNEDVEDGERGEVGAGGHEEDDQGMQ